MQRVTAALLDPAEVWRGAAKDAAEDGPEAPVSEWEPEDMLASFGGFFEDYRNDARWWLTVEMAVAIASGMAAGIGDGVSCPASAC